jgi:hypothetical protein
VHVQQWHTSEAVDQSPRSPKPPFGIATWFGFWIVMIVGVPGFAGLSALFGYLTWQLLLQSLTKTPLGDPPLGFLGLVILGLPTFLTTIVTVRFLIDHPQVAGAGWIALLVWIISYSGTKFDLGSVLGLGFLTLFLFGAFNTTFGQHEAVRSLPPESVRWPRSR